MDALEQRWRRDEQGWMD